MKNELNKITINTTFPLIILANILILSTNFYLTFISIIIFNIYLNFFFLNISLDKSNWESPARIIICSAITILSFLGFQNVPINIGILNNSKVGLVFGINLVFSLYFYFLTKLTEYESVYFFSDDRKKEILIPKYSSREIMRLWIKIFHLTLIIGLLTFHIFSFLGEYYGLILFIISLLIIVNYGKRYGVLDFDYVTPTAINYKLGIFSIIVGVFFIWLGFHYLIGLSFLVLGITNIQRAHILDKSSLKEKFVEYFSLPSLSILAASIIFTLIFGSKNEELDYLLFPKFEKNIYSSIEKKEAEIEAAITNLFEDLKQKQQLNKKIEPLIDFEVERKTNFFFRQEINIKGSFSYNYDSPYLDTIKHYKVGRYRLKDSDITEAIVKSFKISVENYLNNFFEHGTDIEITLDGSSDAKPFSEKKNTAYVGEYGYQIKETTYNLKNEKFKKITIKRTEQLNNESLALLRSFGVRNYIENNIPILNDTKIQFNHRINVESQKIGPEYRRVAIEIKILDILSQL